MISLHLSGPNPFIANTQVLPDWTVVHLVCEFVEYLHTRHMIPRPIPQEHVSRSLWGALWRRIFVCFASEPLWNSYYEECSVQVGGVVTLDIPAENWQEEKISKYANSIHRPIPRYPITVDGPGKIKSKTRTWDDEDKSESWIDTTRGIEGHNLGSNILKEVTRIKSEPQVELQRLVPCKPPPGQSVLNRPRTGTEPHSSVCVPVGPQKR